MAYTQTVEHLEEHNYSEIRNSTYDNPDVQCVATVPNRGTGTTNHQRRTGIIFVLIGLIIGGIISGVVYGTLRIEMNNTCGLSSGFTWSSWSSCSVTCGDGKQYRVKQLDIDHFQTKACKITSCQDCKTDELGLTYNGTMNKTITGRTCQAWNVMQPHRHKYEVAETDSNFCRNPNHQKYFPGPWCFTTDPNYIRDFCPVYQCGTYCSTGFFLCNDGQCILDYWRCNGRADCHDAEDEIGCNNVSECLQDKKGLTYRGKVNVTVSGKSCQYWSSQLPHKHEYTVGTKNYCRNTELTVDKPWCFTTDVSERWNYCNISLCGST